MHCLIISQVFWPDSASTSQHLADLADKLTARNHKVTVFTSSYAYEDPSVRYPAREQKNGIDIIRIKSTSFGKGTIMGRLVDILSFNIILFFKLLFISAKDCDIIIGMTAPPLVSYLGCMTARAKGIKFFYWAMDLQPELAIASGMIKKNSLVARLFTAMGNYIFRKSQGIVALDHFMQEHIISRGAPADLVHVVPVWPVMDEIYTGSRSENPFRIGHGFQDKIVVMYSGNHSYVHPLNTLLNAAKMLKDNDRFLFVFIGGGVRKKDVTLFKQLHSLDNMVQLPYQDRDKIHLSLGSSDIQVVILGENQVGYTHPNKVYGAMFIGKPILYVGPAASHIADIFNDCSNNIAVSHGQSEELVKQLIHFAALDQEEINRIGMQNQAYANSHFNPEQLKNRMADIIEQA